MKFRYLELLQHNFEFSPIFAKIEILWPEVPYDVIITYRHGQLKIILVRMDWKDPNQYYGSKQDHFLGVDCHIM